MRSSWWAEALGPVSVGLAEGAWISVIYLLVETVGRAPMPLSLPVFGGVAFLGALAGPWLERLGDGRWKVIAVAGLGLGVVGMLIAPGAVGALLAGDPGGVFGAQPGGWLLGIAAFRGMLGGATLDDPDRATRPFVRGVIGLAFAWLYAGLLPDAGLAAFRAAAVGPTLLFATAGVAAAGLRRVHAISIPAGIQWWRNRAWLMAMAGLLLLLALVAVPIANELVGGVPGILGLAGFPEVVFFVLFVTWLIMPRRSPRQPTRTAARRLVGVAILVLVGVILYELLHAQNNPGNPAAGARAFGETTTSNGVIGVVIVVAVLVGVGLLALLLARNWRRAGSPADLSGDIGEDVGYEPIGPGLGWLRRARNRLRGRRAGRRPASAEAAYLATLSLLEPLPSVRRLDDETPAAHARRLHRQGAGSLELDLLAADYQLSRWGDRRLPAREKRRAIGRWDRFGGRIAEWIEAEQAALEHAETRGRAGPPRAGPRGPG